MATAKKKASKAKVVAKKKAPNKVAIKKVARKLVHRKTAAKKVVKKVANKPALNLKASKAAARQRPASAKSSLVQCIEKSLDDMKAVNVTVLDVRGLTDVADTMVIASGNSDRHVKAIADRVVYDAKQIGCRAMGVEGERDGEWALVDLGDVIVHIMLPRVREFYRLESLWDISAARRESQM
jgi:ribosome-associated protein